MKRLGFINNVSWLGHMLLHSITSENYMKGNVFALLINLKMKISPFSIDQVLSIWKTITLEYKSIVASKIKGIPLNKKPTCSYNIYLRWICMKFPTLFGHTCNYDP